MTASLLSIAEDHFLNQNQLTLNHAEQVLGTAWCKGADAADVYFQTISSESWVLEDGIVKEGAFHQDQGVGIRTMKGEQTGFAYSEEIALPELMNAAKAARSIVKQGQSRTVSVSSSQKIQAPLYPTVNPSEQTKPEEIIALLQLLDKTARAEDPLVTQVIASFSSNHQIILVMASDGTLAADSRPLCRLNVSVIVDKEGRRERGSSGGGGRDYPAKLFWKENGSASDTSLGYAREAVRQAKVGLEAKPAPAGTMTVVLGPGWPGILLHEAIGHGLEGDFNRRGSSAFSKKMGEMVASSQCSIVDDGTLANRRGSLTIDDEGTPTEKTMLIEKGKLVGYMQDKRNARLMGSSSTGNGRRESYAYLPLPRMTNTYMLPGKYQHQEIIESVDKGIYAPNFGGGQVDITSGKFVFSASEAYLIEKGKITTPIKGATLIGNGPEVLKYVSMVGNNLELDSGVGICGKEGQSVPVGVGQPTLKIDQLLVGGTES